MLKIWMRFANLKSYCSDSVGNIRSTEMSRLLYLIILTSYFLLDTPKQSIASNPDAGKPERTRTKQIVIKKIATRHSIDKKRRLRSLVKNLTTRYLQTRAASSTTSKLAANHSPPQLAAIGAHYTFLPIDILVTDLKPGENLEPNHSPAASVGVASGLENRTATDAQYTFLPIDILAADFKPPDNAKASAPSTAPTSIPVATIPTAPANREPILLPNAKPIPNPAEQGYLIAPRPVSLRRLNPSLTQVVVNDIPVTHRTQFEVTGGADFGERRTTDPSLNATQLDSPEAQESVSNNRVYRLDYRSNYSQLRTVRQQREITTTIVAPQTVFGSRQQLSFVGDCLPGSAGAATASATGTKQICTYLPGLKTDETSVDSQTLIPSRILSTSKFGDIVTPESQLAMKAPGFQAGANGQVLGLDLYFPRIGAEDGNNLGTKTTYDRFESSVTVPTISYGRIHQVILANGKETAIGRTVRGYNYILGDRNTISNAWSQAATELLPDVEPSLPNGKKGGSTEVDRSLILAANNNRVPENSFTAYSAGVGNGFTPGDSRSSTANYRGIWLGFSPVIDRQVSVNGPTFQTIGSERVTLASGGEGGIDTDTSVTALLNQNSYGSNVISNAYVQAYLTKYERDVNTRNITTIREKTDYQPHLSATGNITTQDSVLRYYTGLIFNPDRTSSVNNKAYVGADYTKFEDRGLSYNLAAIGYLNPDNEYYSKLNGTISKQLNLGTNPAYNLNLSTTINYVIDGTKIFDTVSFRSANSYLNVATKTNLGNVSLGAAYYIATGMPNSIGNLVSTSAAWKIADGLVISGYYTPVNDNAARSPFGASASIRLGANPANPTLSLSWNRNEIDLGVDANNNRGGVGENVFSVYLRFDAPLNSFR